MEKSENLDKRRKYAVAFRPKLCVWLSEAAPTARALNFNLQLPYRWQQAHPVAEVGSEALAHDPEMRALRAANKGLA